MLPSVFFNEAFQFEIVAVIAMLCWRSGSHQIEYHIVNVILSCTTLCDRCRQPRMLDRKRIDCKRRFLSLSDDKNPLLDR